MDTELIVDVLNQMSFGVGLFQHNTNQDWILTQTNHVFHDFLISHKKKMESMTLDEIFITHFGLSQTIEPITWNVNDTHTYELRINDKDLLLECVKIQPQTMLLKIHDQSEQKSQQQQFKIYEQVVSRQMSINHILHLNIEQPTHYLQHVLKHTLSMMNATVSVVLFYTQEDDMVLSAHDVHLEPSTLMHILTSLQTMKGHFSYQGPRVLEPSFTLFDCKFYQETCLNGVIIPILVEGIKQADVFLFNKEGGFSEFDAKQLGIVLKSAWYLKGMKEKIIQLHLEQVKLNQIFDQVPLYICEFDENSILKYANNKYSEHVGLPIQSMLGRPFTDFIHEDEREEILTNLSKLSKINPIIEYTHQSRLPHQAKWIDWIDMAIVNESGNIHTYYSLGLDVSEKKQFELQQKEELSMLRSLINSHKAIMYFIDAQSGQLVYANQSACDFYGYSKDEMLQLRIHDINMLSTQEVDSLIMEVKKASQEFIALPHRKKNGEIRLMHVYSTPVMFTHQTLLYVVSFDETDKAMAIKEVEYASRHDFLTKLHNRRHLEEVYLQRCDDGFPMGLILADINGLKLVNDHYGHHLGDFMIKEVARLMQSHLQEVDVFARIGGDEFAILIRHCTLEQLHQLSDHLEKELEMNVEHEGHKLYLSVSFGYALQERKDAHLSSLLKHAESILVERKAFNMKSSRSHLINAMMSTLFQKSEREQNHSKRVAEYSVAIASQLDMSKEQINKLNIAAALHDIGKIVIDEHVLNKPDRLTVNEWKLMREHPTKGANILKEIDEYKEIAHIVEAHHERYDGLGYPHGLIGEAIPLAARIIAVADAYDAMTQFRTYRNAISSLDAIEELLKGKNTQFDAHIVDVFVEILLK